MLHNLCYIKNMKYKEFIKDKNEEIRVAFNSAFQFAGKVYEDRFQSCYNIAIKLQNLPNLNEEEIVNIFKILPASYSKAIFLILNEISSNDFCRYKVIQNKLNEIYVNEFKQKIDERKKLIDFTEKNISNILNCKIRQIDVVEIVTIARIMNYNYIKQILSKDDNEDKYLKALRVAKKNLSTGEIYEKHEEILNLALKNVFTKVQQNLTLLNLDKEIEET